MLAGEIYAPRAIRLIDHPEPTLEGAEPGQILFQPELGCLCGSDLPYFTGQPPEYPCQIGQSLHELIGRVVDSTGERFQPGDRVLCVPHHHYGLWERFAVGEERAIPVDRRATDAEALLAQPLGTALCALRKLPSLIGLDVAVVGQGPMGQLLVASLRNLGARRVIALDRLDERLEVSRAMGASDCINVDRENPVELVQRLTAGGMVDLAIEAVGHAEEAFNLCIDLCRSHGSILYFGVPPETIDRLQWRRAFWKNLTIYTSVNPDFAIDFPLAMQWVAQRRVDVRPLVTHRFPLAEVQQAFETFVDRRDGALKVLLEFPG